MNVYNNNGQYQNGIISMEEQARQLPNLEDCQDKLYVESVQRID